jgi:uncharacterized membrane protein
MFKRALDRMPLLLQLVGGLVLLLWLLGVHTGTVAKVGIALAIVTQLTLYKVRSARFDLSKAESWHLAFLLLWLVLLFGYQFAQVQLGQQGFDFAIFSDIFLHFASSLRLDTILIGSNVESFLTHHFSPILALPGGIAWLGVPPQIAAIIAHVLGVTFALYYLYRFAKDAGLANAIVIFCLVLLALNPTFRIGLSWEVHEETYALPFLALSYLFWQRKQHTKAALALCVCMLCKETFFFFAITFSLMALVISRLEQQPLKKLLPYLIVSLIACFGIWFYILFPPAFIGKTFDATGRISSVSELFSASMLQSKFTFLARLFLPFLLAPFWTLRGAILAFPVVAFLGPILLSNFENMFHPYNYYGVVPTFILAFASVASIQQRFLQVRSIAPAFYLFLICLPLLAGGPVRPMRTILELRRGPLLSAQELKSLPQDAAVVAKDHDIQFLLHQPKIYREWTAERLDLPWTHLVLRKSAKEDFSAKLLAQSSTCQDLPNWIIRCRLE